MTPYRERFKAGMERYEAGDLAAAISDWESIYREVGADKGYRVAFDLARAYDKSGDLAHAAERYLSFLSGVDARRSAGLALESVVLQERRTMLPRERASDDDYSADEGALPCGPRSIRAHPSPPAADVPAPAHLPSGSRHRARTRCRSRARSPARIHSPPSDPRNAPRLRSPPSPPSSFFAGGCHRRHPDRRLRGRVRERTLRRRTPSTPRPANPWARRWVPSRPTTTPRRSPTERSPLRLGLLAAITGGLSRALVRRGTKPKTHELSVVPRPSGRRQAERKRGS